jgi:hypothetical protein
VPTIIISSSEKAIPKNPEHYYLRLPLTVRKHMDIDKLRNAYRSPKPSYSKIITRQCPTCGTACRELKVKKEGPNQGRPQGVRTMKTPGKQGLPKTESPEIDAFSALELRKPL